MRYLDDVKGLRFVLLAFGCSHDDGHDLVPLPHLVDFGQSLVQVGAVERMMMTVNMNSSVSDRFGEWNLHPPEPLSVLLVDPELLAEHFAVHSDLLLTLLHGRLQLQFPRLQGEDAVGLVVQQVPEPLHLQPQDVGLHHAVLIERGSVLNYA